MMGAAVSAEMSGIIRDKLVEISKEEDVLILFAIESGSRAWGFHSPDSDYDVRFVYANPVDWHLKLEKKRDVIERPIDAELDISGWSLGKALTLAMGSNAVIAEWLQSPLVYQQDEAAVTALTQFCKRALDRKSVTWHYRALIVRQASRVPHPEGGIRLKRYFYMLRPALALRWMRVNEAGMPPMNMQELIAGSQLSAPQTKAIAALTTLKMAANESGGVGQTDPLLDSLIEEEQSLAEAWLKTQVGAKQDMALLRKDASQIHNLYSRKAGA